VYEGGEEVAGAAKFRESDFAELLRRCEARGVDVHSMTHVSKDGEYDWHFGQRTLHPTMVLAQWKMEGCAGGWYSIRVYVREEVMEAEGS
jgi:hypothetical protein